MGLKFLSRIWDLSLSVMIRWIVDLKMNFIRNIKNVSWNERNQ